MSRRQAIDLAMDARGKGAASLVSVGPLPEGVKDLLRIVAEGEWRAPSTEHVYRNHSAQDIRAASAAFLAAALFNRADDPYRVLGVAREASAEEVRENKRLLLKWLHPDRNPSTAAKSHLARVLAAAEAIEDGRARQAAQAAVTPPRIVVTRRSKPKRRSKSNPAKQAAYQLVDSFGRVAKILMTAAAVTIVCLLAWRFIMNEPIGASIERYSRLTLGTMRW